jgi:hypothetical protein
MLNKLRYAHPLVTASTLLVLIAALLFVSIVAIGWLRTSEFAKATGMAAAAERAYAFHQALYWSGRALLHDDAATTIQPTRVYGTIAGLTPKGLVVVNIYEGAEIKTREIKLADVSLDNPRQYAQEVVAVRDMNAEFDIYPPSDEVVVWMNRQPWNVHLIVCGAMRPDERPPTNIVDKAFSEYYWRLAQGENQ